MTDPYSDPTRPPDPLPPPGPLPPHQLPYGQPASPAPYPHAPVSPPPQVIIVPAANPPTSTFAVLGLIFGILGLISGCCTFGVFSVVAVICGHAGLRETNSNANAGHGMAVAALVMGYIGIIPAIFLSISMVTGGLSSGLNGGATP